MPAEHLAPVVSRAHVDVRIELAVHRIDGPRQGNDLKIPLKLVGVVFLLVHLIHAHGKVVGCPQRRDAGQPDVLLLRDLLYLRKYLLALIHSGDDAVPESSVLHATAPPVKPPRGKRPRAFAILILPQPAAKYHPRA